MHFLLCEAYDTIHCADWGVSDYGDVELMNQELDTLFTKVTAKNLKLNEFDHAMTDNKFEKQKITGMVVVQPNMGNGPKILQSDVVDSLKRDDCKMTIGQTKDYE